MSENTEYRDILSALDDAQTKNTTEIKATTTGSKCTFKKITVNQQKNILKSAVDVNLPELQFLLQVNNILQENQVTDIPLYVTDRTPVMLALRYATLGGEVSSANTNIDNETPSIDITNHIKTFSKRKIKTSLAKHTFTTEGFKIDCEVPSLIKDTEINLACLKAIKGKLKTEEGLKDSVGEVFVYEIIKYIDTISISGEEEPLIVPFGTLPINHKISIFEKLPMSVSILLSKYITRLREHDNNFLMIPPGSIGLDDTKEDIELSFSAGFFSLE
jgi:hypothetical protein